MQSQVSDDGDLEIQEKQNDCSKDGIASRTNSIVKLCDLLKVPIELLSNNTNCEASCVND